MSLMESYIYTYGNVVSIQIVMNIQRSRYTYYFHCQVYDEIEPKLLINWLIDWFNKLLFTETISVDKIMLNIWFADT